MMRTRSLVLLTITAFAAAACTPKPEPVTPPRIGMPNPASVHCIEQGGSSKTRTLSTGGEYGVCVFEDGRQCQEWPLFRDGLCTLPKDDATAKPEA